MNKITICIPTYKRPEMLRKLTLSIFGCNFDRSMIGDVTIIIADNDSEKTAETIANEMAEIPVNIKIHYFCYLVKGLSNIRNELLRKAFALKSDFIIFIDDDEYVTSDWLNELVRTIISNNAEAARGPVLTNLDKQVPGDIRFWFNRESYPADSKISTLTTGNLILRRSFIEQSGIWFDNRFNKTGSEDSYFGIQIVKKGAAIFWAAKALAFETIPKSRSNIKWLMKRFYNGANTYTYILKLEKENLKLFKKTLTSLVYIMSGLFSLFLTLIPSKYRYWGLIKLSEGFGGITGLFSIKYHEYN